MKLPSRYKPTGKDFSEGGMSDAILCEDRHLERLVLVKKLKEGTDPKVILDEIAALQSITSKHVVQIYDAILDENNYPEAIVEEFVDGPNLTKVKNGAEFLKIAYAIAEGIADIHAHGCVHRDIKGQNMKFDSERCLKIFDFGLARILKDSTTAIAGTPGYLAPELFEPTLGGTIKYTAAVDTFAFAATLIALAIGKLPYEMRKMPPVLPCAEADFSKLPIKLPDEIASSLNNCLNVHSAKRPAMADVTRLLGRHLLRNRHRALLVNQGKSYVLDNNNAVVELSVKGKGSVEVSYDGLCFSIRSVSGHVSINNMPALNGAILPGSCVICLGAPADGLSRRFVTVDISHPEVPT